MILGINFTSWHGWIIHNQHKYVLDLLETSLLGCKLDVSPIDLQHIFLGYHISTHGGYLFLLAHGYEGILSHYHLSIYCLYSECSQSVYV